MWPGVFSLSSQYYPQGGTVMFAILALAGDIGCSAGPGLVGFISNKVKNSMMTFTNSWFYGSSIIEISFKTGLLLATIFPFIMLVSVIVLRKRNVKIGDLKLKNKKFNQ